jgi:adenosylcobinamide-GDP ribazoletransferase
MSTQWRLFVTALRFVAHRPPAADAAEQFPVHQATRFIPLAGILVGMIGAAIYWLAAQLWPTSVAVVLAMLGASLVTGNVDYRAANALASTGDLRTGPARFGALYWLFVLLIDYNALMALSAANLPLALPDYWALGLIMVAGNAASRALLVSVMATHVASSLRVTTNDLSVALIVGLAPASLLGIPGLIGLAAAILMRLALTSYVLPGLKFAPQERLDITQHLTEACFYLGALAAWKYV